MKKDLQNRGGGALLNCSSVCDALCTRGITPDCTVFSLPSGIRCICLQTSMFTLVTAAAQCIMLFSRCAAHHLRTLPTHSSPAPDKLFVCLPELHRIARGFLTSPLSYHRQPRCPVASRGQVHRAGICLAWHLSKHQGHSRFPRCLNPSRIVFDLDIPINETLEESSRGHWLGNRCTIAVTWELPSMLM